MDNPVIIIGAKGIAISALEIFKSNDVVVYGFLDDDETIHNTEIDNIPILGRTEDDGFLKLIGKKAEAFIAVDENDLRKGLVKLIVERRKKMPVNAVHQKAVIAESAHIGHGNFISAGVVIGANAKVENHCIIHPNAVVDYGAELKEYVQVGAGSNINAGVKVGKEVFIGSGATIVSGITIGDGARIGAGSLVIADVEKGQTVFGNPAQPVNK